MTSAATTHSGTSSFRDMVKADARPADLQAYLESLSAEARVAEVMSLPGRLQPKLFEQLKGQASISMAEFVPNDNETYIFELRNSLPAFNRSQKRFFRPTGETTVGYNHTDKVALTFAGPGYFFAEDGEEGELKFDYTRLPTHQPEGWPPIIANRGRLRGVVYADMIDYCRKIAEGCVIGAAFKHGKPRNQYFLLARSADRT